MLALTGRIVRDDGLAAPAPQPRPEGITVVGGIGQAAFGRQLGDQGRCDGHIAPMARGGRAAGGARPAASTAAWDFGRAAPPGPPDGLLERPPFPPAAERCTWTGVESSSRAIGGPPAAASSANTWSQTPLRAASVRTGCTASCRGHS